MKIDLTKTVSAKLKGKKERKEGREGGRKEGGRGEWFRETKSCTYQIHEIDSYYINKHFWVKHG